MRFWIGPTRTIRYAVCFVALLMTARSFGENSLETPILIQLQLPAQEAPMLSLPDPDGSQHLSLARIYAGAQQYTKAYAEYEKAITSKDGLIQATALYEVGQLLKTEDSWSAWVKRKGESLVGWLLWPILLFSVACVLRLLFGAYVALGKPRPRLEVSGLSGQPDRDVSLGCLRALLRTERLRLESQSIMARRVSYCARNTVLPTVLSTSVADNWGIPIELVPDRLRPVFGWFFNFIYPPTYTVGAVVNPSGENIQVIVALSNRRRELRYWTRAVTQTDLGDCLHDIAYEIISALKEQGFE